MMTYTLRLSLNLWYLATLLLPTSSAFGVSATSGIRDSWAVLVVGDLHLEDDMAMHQQARQDCLQALQDCSILVQGTTLTERIQQLKDKVAQDLTVEELELLWTYQQTDLCQSYMVSLGDLGRKDIRHEPGDAGTTKSFQDAKTFLDGFGLPYDLVTGNHDLEGLDEFETDEDNLQAFLQTFERETPYFSRQIGEKTLLVGLSTVRFRESPYSSHEVHIDDDQIDWFVKTVEQHPAQDGWKILVFSHAPIMGSGLRVLQSVHITNGCAWLNHCSEGPRKRFMEVVRANPQIKCWASGHFHLSHDFEDSITHDPQQSTCAFLQVGVMGPQSTRDDKRQTRLIQGTPTQLKIYTINHHLRDASTGKAVLRLDATLDLDKNVLEKVNHDEARQELGDKWFQAFVPREEDGCYMESPDGSIATNDKNSAPISCWWHMADGRVLGWHANQLIEYDADTLSPLGAHGCPLPHDIYSLAARQGQLEVLIWARGAVNMSWDKQASRFAAFNGHLNVLKWAKENDFSLAEETCRQAAASGCLDVLIWARRNECYWDESTCTVAAARGHFKILEWAHKNGCPWNSLTCSSAARHGHLDILKYAHRHGCPWDASTCSSAAFGGHLKILKWARKHDCPWNEQTCSNAATHAHLDILQWARANGCPWDKWTCLKAGINGNLEVLLWARFNDCPE